MEVNDLETNEYGDDDWATPEKENVMELKEQIINDIKSNPIILYMKGTKDMPMCGFSSSVVQILNHYDVEYKDVNVLEDSEIRVKLSEHSNWPTIPQLFINGELVGGADIAMEMHNSGELETMLDTIETKKTPDVHRKLTNEKLAEKWKEVTSQVLSKHESIRD